MSAVADSARRSGLPVWIQADRNGESERLLPRPTLSLDSPKAATAAVGSIIYAHHARRLGDADERRASPVAAAPPANGREPRPWREAPR